MLALGIGQSSVDAGAPAAMLNAGLVKARQAEGYTMWCQEPRFDPTPETETYGVSCAAFDTPSIRLLANASTSALPLCCTLSHIVDSLPAGGEVVVVGSDNV